MRLTASRFRGIEPVIPSTLIFLVLGGCLLISGCSQKQPSSDPASIREYSGGSTEPVEHWRLDPLTLETELASGRIEILSERYAGAGLTGASRVELRLLDQGLTVSAKWKPVPLFLDGINNSPRKEIAAYHVQKLVLEPEDYVIPTSVARCIPAAEFPSPTKHSKGTLPDSNCELGIFSVWLENVTVPDMLLDSDRFEREAAYARHLGNFNLVTYLIRHHDGRRGNFLVSTNESDRRVFAVDNGVAFSGIWYNWFVPNWNRIRVPAIPEDAIEKLRQIRELDLEPLAVVAEFHRDPNGGWSPRPSGIALDEDDGARLEGSVFQLGLTEDEIEDLYKRIEDLVEDVQGGRLGVLTDPIDAGVR